MPANLVLTHDGSDLANAAVPYAAALSRALGSEVTLLRVVEPSVADSLEERALVETSLAVVQAALDHGGALAVHLAIRPGDPGPTIVDETRGGRARMVVIATHGRSGLRRTVLGSVATYVLHNTEDLPVVLCYPGHPSVSIQRLLIPLDGSERANEAIPIAQEIAVGSGAAVTLLTVVDSVAQIMAMATPAGFEYEPALSVEQAEETVAAQRASATRDLEAIAARLRTAGVSSVEVEVAEGVPGSAIAEYVQRLPADLVVIATRGRGGAGRALLGSVADYVVRHAGIGVVAVRPRMA
jgi:nucleotide-binding universal stress UspA family protein